VSGEKKKMLQHDAGGGASENVKGRKGGRLQVRKKNTSVHTKGEKKSTRQFWGGEKKGRSESLQGKNVELPTVGKEKDRIEIEGTVEKRIKRTEGRKKIVKTLEIFFLGGLSRSGGKEMPSGTKTNSRASSMSEAKENGSSVKGVDHEEWNASSQVKNVSRNREEGKKSLKEKGGLKNAWGCPCLPEKSSTHVFNPHRRPLGGRCLEEKKVIPKKSQKKKGGERDGGLGMKEEAWKGCLYVEKKNLKG